VVDGGRTVSQAGRDHRLSWPVAMREMRAYAAEVLSAEPLPTSVIGIDEIRRGAPRWEQDAAIGKYRLIADRWHVGSPICAGVKGCSARSKAAWRRWSRPGRTPGPLADRLPSARLFAWCADHAYLPELVTLAQSIATWWAEIEASVHTGITKCQEQRNQPGDQARSALCVRLPQHEQPTPPITLRNHPLKPKPSYPPPKFDDPQ
jgi:hypothetical protein